MGEPSTKKQRLEPSPRLPLLVVERLFGLQEARYRKEWIIVEWGPFKLEMTYTEFQSLHARFFIGLSTADYLNIAEPDVDRVCSAVAQKIYVIERFYLSRTKTDGDLADFNEETRTILENWNK